MVNINNCHENISKRLVILVGLLLKRTGRLCKPMQHYYTPNTPGSCSSFCNSGFYSCFSVKKVLNNSWTRSSPYSHRLREQNHLGEAYSTCRHCLNSKKKNQPHKQGWNQIQRLQKAWHWKRSLRNLFQQDKHKTWLNNNKVTNIVESKFCHM